MIRIIYKHQQNRQEIDVKILQGKKLFLPSVPSHPRLPDDYQKFFKKIPIALNFLTQRVQTSGKMKAKDQTFWENIATWC